MSSMILLALHVASPAHAAVSDEYGDYVVALLQDDGFNCGRVAFTLQAMDDTWSCTLFPIQRSIVNPLGCLAALDAGCVDVGGTDADGDGFSLDAGDCDDADPLVNPGAAEICDGVDNDCDGSADTDAVDAPSWYRDADADGYGSGPVVTTACTAAGALVAVDGDCQPLDPTISPGEPEVCDGIDNDCDGVVDVDAVDATTWYKDADGDGAGDPTSSMGACDQPAGYVADRLDCDDTHDTVYVGAPEVCDDLDNDCDGITDDDAVDRSWFYADADGDGFGDGADAVQACSQPGGYIVDDTDCDDGDEHTYPGAPELCDDAPNDCDGAWTSDAGTASVVDAAGGWSDVTDALGAGTDGAPAAYTLADGDTLYVCEGTWYVTLDADASATFVGVGDAASVVLDGGGVDRVVDASNTGEDVWIENLTIQRGYSAGSGGGVSLRNLASVTLVSVSILDSEAAIHGGAGYFWNLESMYWSDVYIGGNTSAGYGGGAIVANTTLWEGDELTFEGNSSTTTSAYGGGALASYGTTNAANLRGLYLYDNTSTRYGGGWEVYGGSYAVEGCTISGNVGASGGGGIDVGDASDLALTSCDILDNTGPSGGLREQGTFTGDRVVFDGNVGTSSAGAMQVSSGAIASCADCEVTNNTSTTAAVNVKSGEATFDASYFYNNDPADLYAASTAYTFDGYVTFTCTDSSCL